MPRAAEDSWVLGRLLLMIWGSLRWSDAQRLEFSSLKIDTNVIIGWCWRAKTAKSGMLFGVLTAGIARASWGLHFGKLLSYCCAEEPERDFLLARHNKPLGYAAMVAHMRRCLCLYGGLRPELAMRFTLHSCKATILSVSAGPTGRSSSCTGPPWARQMVKKYGRDDAWPQIHK